MDWIERVIWLRWRPKFVLRGRTTVSLPFQPRSTSKRAVRSAWKSTTKPTWFCATDVKMPTIYDALVYYLFLKGSGSAGNARLMSTKSSRNSWCRRNQSRKGRLSSALAANRKWAMFLNLRRVRFNLRQNWSVWSLVLPALKNTTRRAFLTDRHQSTVGLARKSFEVSILLALENIPKGFNEFQDFVKKSQ